MTSIYGSGASSPPIAFAGLASGLNTTSIIQALMQINSQPLVDLQQQQQLLSGKVADYQMINSQLQALQQAGDALAQPSTWTQALAASSSNSATATGSVGSGSLGGSVTFVVNQLAQGNTLFSAGSVAATSDVVTSASALLLATGGNQLGLGSLTTSGLTLGSHAIKVTQASAAAQTVGTTAIAASSASPVTISSTNNTISLNLNGTATTYTLASGTYTSPTQLAAAVQTALGSAFTASVNSSGMLQVATTQQGSAATLQITSGSANSALGLTAMTSATTGTNGVISVDGTATTITSIAANGSTTVSLASGTGGSVSAQLLGGGLTVGSLTATNVSTGNGSLASVVSAINAAGAGITASSVQTGTSAYALSLSSTTTGVVSDLNVNTSAFSSSSLGALATTTAGQDAVIAIGGASGQQVSSASNQVTGLLPGLTVNLLQTTPTGGGTTTITVAPSANAVAGQVQSLVTAANNVLSTIASDTAYNVSTKQAGPLNGDIGLSTLMSQIEGMVAQAVGSSTIGSGGSTAGLSLTTKGQIAFNQQAFTTAFNVNPTAVAAMFQQGGTFTPASSSYAGQVALAGAADPSLAGNYAVVVSQSASQATKSGTVSYASGTSTVAGAENVAVTMNGKTASYGVTAGESLQSIAQGLDSAFAGASLGLSAQVVTNASGASVLQVTSANYGSAQKFSVATSGTTGQLGIATTGVSGTDVAGTINGVAATGLGQVLSAPVTDPTLAGLALQVSATGVTTSTTLGTFHYTPGLAQQLATLGMQTTAPVSGMITSTIQGLQASSTSLGTQIVSAQSLLNQQQAQLTQEYNNLEVQMSTLKSTGAFVSSTLNNLPPP